MFIDLRNVHEIFFVKCNLSFRSVKIFSYLGPTHIDVHPFERKVFVTIMVRKEIYASLVVLVSSMNLGR